MFSGGKDSLAALMRMHEEGAPPTRLLLTFSESDGRVALHGTPVSLIRRQAAALGLPLTEIALPPNCDDVTYRDRVAAALAPLRRDGLTAVAFGDLHLEDIRRFREDQFGKLDLACRFPLWGRDTSELARELIDSGLEAVLCCVDLERISEDWLSRRWDDDFLEALPSGCDPCGENGEFHTFVVAAPNMTARVDVTPAGRHVIHGRFCMLDLRPG